MSAVRLTHIGGPTVLLEVEGWRILTDPTFDPPGGTYPFGLGTSSRKLSGPAVPAEELGPIDAALVSHHHHGDNLDNAGRDLLAGAGTVVTTTAGARDLGGGAIGLVPWATHRLEAPGRPAIEVSATPCRHGPPLSRPIVGDVIGFALAWEGQEHGVLWISGDTVLYDGVREVARRLDVDLAVLHLGAVRFGLTGPIRYSMTAHDGGAGRPAAAPDGGPGPLRGLVAFLRGPGGHRPRAGGRARRRAGAVPDGRPRHARDDHDVRL